MEWKKQIREYRIQHEGHNIQRENFAPLLNLTLSKLDKSILINGFRTTGLCPFNPNAIDYQKYLANVNLINEQVDVESFQNQFIDDDILFLRALEKKIGNKLDFFEANSHSLKWNGNVEDQSLFELWIQLKIRVEEIKTTENNVDIETDISYLPINTPENNVDIETDDISTLPIILQNSDGSFIEITNVSTKDIQLTQDIELDLSEESTDFHLQLATSILGSCTSAVKQPTVPASSNVENPSNEPLNIQDLDKLSNQHSENSEQLKEQSKITLNLNSATSSNINTNNSEIPSNFPSSFQNIIYFPKENPKQKSSKKNEKIS